MYAKMWRLNPSIRFCTRIRSCITQSNNHRRSLSSDYNSNWQYQQSSSVIDVTPLADSIRSHIREYTRKEKLKLVGILVGSIDELDSEIYSDRIRETFEEDGIDYVLWRYPDLPPNDDETKIRWIKEQIHIANECTDVHGILIFYPIYPSGSSPKGPYKNRLTGVYYKTQDDHIRDLVHPTKDVEGFCGTKWFKIREQKAELPSIYPCTALSVLRILQEYHISNNDNNNKIINYYDGDNEKNDSNNKINYGGDSHTDNNLSIITGDGQEWKDQTISIVNRSEIMGRPLAVMLSQMGATVYSIDINSILEFRPNGGRLRRCNAQTTTLESCLKKSNIVVTGVPHESFQLPLSSIAEATTIVNVSEFPNICEETLIFERPDIKYIPNVGKVTVAVLENNLMNLKINNSISTTLDDSKSIIEI
ncbi:MAG: methylenetetrahydrofolate dehydrogenase (NAD+) [Bacillariaceae sp.]|jgi:methylenetetrahydrofolate dehydrogenase (NAD+)